MIEIRNLTKIYRVNPIIKDLSVTINDGEIISIIGPSGCGKSTFIKCINMLERPSSGQIFIDGEEITAPGYDLSKIARKVGMVFQNFNLFNHMTAIENIMIPQMDILKLSRQEAYERSLELLRRVNLTSKAFNYPDQLSGGQQQRIAIARTLAMDPQIILFDEPISALDPTMVDEVKAVIRDLTHSGKTMLIVTHDMDFARTIAKRVFYMEEGGIYEEGDPDRIFLDPQREKTRQFVNKLKVLNFRIDTKEYDFYGAYTNINEYCLKNQISYIKNNHIQSIFEELCQGILLHRLDDYKVDFKVVYSQKENDVQIQASYGNEAFNALEDEDDISVKMIKGFSSSISYEETKGEYANILSIKVE
ncbi:MAG: amino acid ABC transporter ATP-binding protein [Erysipelotrichaceae bacterium]|nr:amino acid ABC transporter ATP-binding protein [Erysipelotrichaceae bacterium]